MKELFAAAKNKRIFLKTYNKTSITLLDVCKAKIKHNNKQKHVNSFKS